MIEIKSKINIIILYTRFRTFFDFKSIGGFWHFLDLHQKLFFNVANIFPVSGDHNYYKKELNFSKQFTNEKSSN